MDFIKEKKERKTNGEWYKDKKSKKGELPREGFKSKKSKKTRRKDRKKK